MYIEIDENSGFCFGVTTAIRKAEEELANGETLYCLGDIVHNGKECERLGAMGLKSVDKSQLEDLEEAKVMFRAHGEPPSTYLLCRQNNIEIIDATCPVVLQLQQRIRARYCSNPNEQIVIFGKPGHAEVLGLVGQTEGHAIVLSGPHDISKIDFERDVCLFSQTTKPLSEFQKIERLIRERIVAPATFSSYDTICRRVSNRIPRMIEFASRHEAVLFVCGRKSSNGKVLFEACKRVNPHTFFAEGPDDMDFETLGRFSSLGICGATSTPKWLMEQCREAMLDNLRGK